MAQKSTACGCCAAHALPTLQGMNTAHALMHPLLRRLRAETAPATRAAAPLQHLPPGAALTLQGQPGRRVQVQRGRLWITEPGDEHDHFIDAGGSHTMTTRGTVVIECVGTGPARWGLD
jgi:Protein of unknown function (DUF2917)